MGRILGGQVQSVESPSEPASSFHAYQRVGADAHTPGIFSSTFDAIPAYSIYITPSYFE